MRLYKIGLVDVTADIIQRWLDYILTGKKYMLIKLWRLEWQLISTGKSTAGPVTFSHALNGKQTLASFGQIRFLAHICSVDMCIIKIIVGSGEPRIWRTAKTPDDQEKLFQHNWCIYLSTLLPRSRCLSTLSLIIASIIKPIAHPLISLDI